MQKSGLLILCILSAMLYPSISWSQNPHPHFQNFTTDHGLPSPETYCILQDSKGYIWFGTDNGVSRFNGYTFESYSVTNGLKNSVVFHLQEDKSGRIWMSTMAGNLYYFEEGRIYPYRYNHLLQQYNRSNIYAIHNFHFSPDGSLYAAIRFTGILKIDKEGHETLYKGEEVLHDLIFKIPDGPILIAHIRDINYVPLSSETHQYLKFYFNGQYSKQNIPRMPNYDSSKSILELTQEEGYIIHGNNHQLYMKEAAIQWLKPSGGVTLCSYESSGGEIFIAKSNGAGIRRYKNLQALHDDEYEQYLDGYSISSITQDQQGGYWISSLEQGIFYCSNMDMKIYDRSNGFANNLITAVTAKDKSEVYAGLRSGEVYALSTKTSTLKQLPGKTIENRIFDLKYDPLNQRLWNAGILYYYENNDWQPFIWKEQDLFPPNIQIKEIFILPEKHKLWANGAKGTAAFDIRENKILYKSWDDFERNSTKRTLAVFEAPDERVWVGTVGGLFEVKNDQMIPVMDPDSIFSIRVEDIDMTKDSVLVVGTKGAGIVLWKDNLYQYLDVSKGLTSNMVEHVHVDDNNTIWIGTLSGLNKLTKNQDGQYHAAPITMAHGLPSNEINALTSVEEELWVATPRGLVNFPASDFSRSSPSPIIEKIIANNEALGPKALSDLRANQNNLQFSFIAINYPLIGDIRYRYRLRSNASWTSTKARSANFLTLAPGKYQFEVQAQNENGRWSDSATLQLTIHPPFWQTAWFMALAALLILSLGYFLYRFRINRIIEQNQLQRKIDQLERSALKAQMNPHFIFNCLNSIQSFILEGNKKEAADYLARFAKLIRSILNFSSSGSALLDEEIVALKNYLMLEQMRFKHRFDYRINIDSKIDPLLIKVPTMLVQPFVENAIIHGIASRKSGGLIEINYRIDQNYLEVHIQDNGKGFLQEKPLSSIHKSVGMSITQRRLELLNRDSQQKGVEIQELKDEQGQIIGTIVHLKIRMLPV